MFNQLTQYVTLANLPLALSALALLVSSIIAIKLYLIAKHNVFLKRHKRIILPSVVQKSFNCSQCNTKASVDFFHKDVRCKNCGKVNRL